MGVRGGSFKGMKNRHFLLAFTSISTLIFGGVVSGWPALRLAIQGEGRFWGASGEPTGGGRGQPLGGAVANAGTARSAALVYALATFGMGLSRLVSAAVFSRIGAGAAGAVCLLSTTLGGILTSQAGDKVALLQAGFFFLGLGGPGLVAVTEAVSLLYAGRVRELVAWSQAALLHLSALVFLAFYGLYTNEGFGPLRCLLVYLFFAACFAWLCPVFVPADVLVLLPKKKMADAGRRVLAAVRLKGPGAFGLPKPKGAAGGLAGLAGLAGRAGAASHAAPASSSSPPATPTKEGAGGGGVVDAMVSPVKAKVLTVGSQVQTTSFWLYTLFLCLQWLLSEFWIATCNDQLSLKVDRHGTSDGPKHTKWFVLVSALMFVAAPVGGALASKIGLWAVMVLVNLLFVIHNAVLLSNGAEIQMLGFLAYGLGRCLLHGTLSGYLRERFGAVHSRVLNGVTTAIAGSFSLLILLLAQLALLDNDHRFNYRAINAYFVFQSAILLLYPMYVMAEERAIREAKARSHEASVKMTKSAHPVLVHAHKDDDDDNSNKKETPAALAGIPALLAAPRKEKEKEKEDKVEEKVEEAPKVDAWD